MVNPKPPRPAAPAMTVRPDASTAAALAAARRATGGAIPPHRLALAALTIGARAIAARPSLVFEATAGPIGEGEEGEALAGPLEPAEPPPRPEPRPASPSPPGGPLAAPLEAPPSPAPPAPPPPPATAVSDGRRATAAEVDGARPVVRAALAAGHSARALATAAGAEWSGAFARGARGLQGEAPLSINRATLAALVRGARALLGEGGR